MRPHRLLRRRGSRPDERLPPPSDSSSIRSDRSGGAANTARGALRSCYKASLALQNRAASIDRVPADLVRHFRVPKERALLVAILQIRSFLQENDMTVRLVLYTPIRTAWANGLRQTACVSKSTMEYATVSGFRRREGVIGKGGHRI
jgi:hypothetical protein